MATLATVRAEQPPERHSDLRDVIDRIERMGELRRIDGANWDLEIGALLEMVYHAEPNNPPSLLFDNIKGYPSGFRISSGTTNSPRRFAMLLGFPEPKHPLDVVRAYRDRMRGDFKLIPPRVMKDGPVLENVQRDGEVNILKFPVPRLHERDGGRYIGTDDLIIMRDPETGWVNVATYRVQAHDANTTGLWMSPGKQGNFILEKYTKKGEPCPVLISCGHDPLLFMSASNPVPYGQSEYAYAAGHKGRPYDVIESEIHKLPMPADAEIVLEGEIMVNERRPEGPFGEFAGYYASDVRIEPTVRIRRVYHRTNPILTVACPMRPPMDYMAAKSMIHSGMIWDEMERAGMPGICGVWIPWATRQFTVISIKQMYPGHAKQALMLASSCQSGAYFGRYTVVVDDDIDPTDDQAVMWALGTRSDPATGIDIARQTWSTALDPMLPKPPYHNSRAMIDACRPWAWRNEFPAVAEASPELMAATKAKWSHLLKQ
jgi:4-hydroxy-3-polyprenylbenzoate decarboxylase